MGRRPRPPTPPTRTSRRPKLPTPPRLMPWGPSTPSDIALGCVPALLFFQFQRFNDLISLPTSHGHASANCEMLNVSWTTYHLFPSLASTILTQTECSDVDSGKDRRIYV